VDRGILQGGGGDGFGTRGGLRRSGRSGVKLLIVEKKGTSPRTDLLFQESERRNRNNLKGKNFALENDSGVNKKTLALGEEFKARALGELLVNGVTRRKKRKERAAKSSRFKD